MCRIAKLQLTDLQLGNLHLIVSEVVVKVNMIFKSLLGVLFFVVTSKADPISGRVVDLAGNSIPDAKIVLVSTDSARNNLVTITKADGRYAFHVVPSGAYSIEASCVGFLRLRYDPIVIKYPNALTLNLVLPFDWNAVIMNEIGDTEARVSGELQRGGSPLSDAEICLARDQTRHCVRTNEIGQYSIQVEPGEYQVLISNRGNIIGNQSLQLIKPGDYWNVIVVRPSTAK